MASKRISDPVRITSYGGTPAIQRQAGIWKAAATKHRFIDAFVSVMSGRVGQIPSLLEASLDASAKVGDSSMDAVHLLLLSRLVAFFDHVSQLGLQDPGPALNQMLSPRHIISQRVR